METIQDIFRYINEFSDAITAMTTVVVAALTWVLANDNRTLRKAGTEPEVISYLAPHPDGNGGVNFVLANVGQGPAFAVKFELICDEEDFGRHDVHLVNDPKRTALTVLPQGEKIGSLFGIGYVLFGNDNGGSRIPLQPFEVKISYKGIRGQRHQSLHKIDITQFAGLAGLLAKPAERDIADTLKKIERHLAKLARESTQIADLLDSTTLSDSYRNKVPGKKPDR